MNNLIAAIFGISFCLSLCGAEPCDSEVRNGKGGVCIPTGDCANGNYISNYCPSYGADIKCCFSPKSTGEPCESEVRDGSLGKCIATSECSGGNYVSNLCPSYPWNVKCCFSSGGSSSSLPSGSGNCPRIIPRSGWGASPPKSTPSKFRSAPQYVVIHHAHTPACDSESSCARKVKDFQNWHQNDNGWSDIGYNFVIGGDGSVFEGRGWDNVGAHCSGWNSKSMGICFVGNFDHEEPTKAAVDAAHELIGCLVQKGKVQSNYMLKGHRDLGSTTCPGDVLYGMIQQWPHYS